jgi:hypothetical protein
MSITGWPLGPFARIGTSRSTRSVKIMSIEFLLSWSPELRTLICGATSARRSLPNFFQYTYRSPDCRPAKIVPPETVIAKKCF